MHLDFQESARTLLQETLGYLKTGLTNKDKKIMTDFVNNGINFTSNGNAHINFEKVMQTVMRNINVDGKPYYPGFVIQDLTLDYMQVCNDLYDESVEQAAKKKLMRDRT
jgi:hypothetical protein